MKNWAGRSKSYKRSFILGYVGMSLMIGIGIAMTVYNFQKDTQFEQGKKKYTIATFKKHGRKDWRFKYMVSGKEYVVPSGKGQYDDHSYKRYMVAYLENDPANSEIMSAEFVSNDTLKSPVNGWDSIPSFIRD